MLLFRKLGLANGKFTEKRWWHLPLHFEDWQAPLPSSKAGGCGPACSSSLTATAAATGGGGLSATLEPFRVTPLHELEASSAPHICRAAIRPAPFPSSKEGSCRARCWSTSGSVITSSSVMGFFCATSHEFKSLDCKSEVATSWSKIRTSVRSRSTHGRRRKKTYQREILKKLWGYCLKHRHLAGSLRCVSGM